IFFQVREFVVHEEYEKYMRNDIALLKLWTPFDFVEGDGRVGPICLPRTNPPNRAGLELAGWGGSVRKGTPRFLRTAVAQLKVDDFCRMSHSEYTSSLMLCSGPLEKDACE
ncbi:unnamed protein product, partial [Ixodes hexagonus]